MNMADEDNMKCNRLLGVIGGMGVQATARFYAMITAMQAVRAEQEYLDMIIYSKPSIPDRTAFITRESNISPLEPLIDAAKTLARARASCIVMPCVSAHYFYEDLTRMVNVPIINMMEETAQYVRKSGYSKIGLLATDGTLQGRLFHEAFVNQGVEVVLPQVHAQEFLSKAIYQLKRGEVPSHTLDSLSANLHNFGAEAIVLGCTELGLLQRSKKYMYIEAMEVLACAAIDFFRV